MRRCAFVLGSLALRLFALWLIALPLTSASEIASAETRTIRFMAPTAPGGVVDFLARLMAQQIGAMQDATITVENRPGANGAIGTEVAARATPDGNTVLIAANNFLTDPLLRRVGYDPLTSFEPICELVSAPTVIVVNASSQYQTLADLIAAARTDPGAVSMASIGPGSPFQISFEVLKRAAKADMTFVPYPGNAPAVTALLGEHVTSMFGSYSNVAEHLKSGKLRALVVATPRRVKALPDVPTIAEAGYKDAELDAWFGAFAPAGTPKDDVARLASWFTAAMRAPEVEEKLRAQELYPAYACGAEFAALMRKQYDALGRLVRDTHIEAK
jgi:tripartite-type tricarboxylate transporter receptor subunit TctC